MLCKDQEQQDHNNLISNKSYKDYYDKRYINLSIYKKRKEKAIEIVKKSVNFCYKENMAISCSFGKDSIVVLDLIIKYISKDIKVMFINQGCDYPETIALMEYYRDILDYNVIEYQADISIEDYYIRRNKEKLPDFGDCIFFNPIKKFSKDNDIKLQFIGIRKEESNARKICLSKLGDSYFCKGDKKFHINPIANFTGDDIWGYIYENKLMFASLYNKNKFFERDKLNNCPFGIFKMWTYGKIVHLKYYYPELYSWFSKYYDKTGCYV